MALLPGLFAARNSTGNGTSPRGARRALGGLLARGGAGPVVRTGVLFDDGTPVVSGTGTWAISIRPFTAVAKYTDSNGPVIFANDSVDGSVEIDPAPGSGSRIDIVWARQPLVDGDGGGGDSVQPELGVASSDPSGSPTPPLDQIPAGAVEIGRATITAGMTSSADAVWSVPQWTVANGGVLPLGDGRYQVWDGTAWVEMASARREGPWTPSTGEMLNGWNRSTGATALRFWRTGDTITVEGGVANGGTNTAALIVPEWARPVRSVVRVSVPGNGPDNVVDILSNGEFRPRGANPGIPGEAQFSYRIGV